MKPISFIYVFVLVFAIVGYPMAMLFDQDGLFFVFVRNVDSSYVNQAYVWTLISALLLLLLNVLFGSHRNFDEFLAKPTVDGFIDPGFFWMTVICCSIAMNVYFFVRMDYSLPLLNVSGSLSELLNLRIEIEERLNPILFNLNATVLGPLSLILSIIFVSPHRRTKILFSSLNFLVIGTFSLAKSAFIIGIIIVILAYSFVNSIRKSTFIKLGALMILLLLPMFLITKAKEAPEGASEAVAEVISARIFYGQWAALPYFFDLFDKDKQSMAVLLPPYLSDGNAWERNGEEVPPRKVMRAVTGYRNLEGTGTGVAVTYFIGEAFAVGGKAGILLGCFLVAAQIWIMTHIFRRLKKTPLTVYLYSWCIYKICMGLITGLSAFIVSSFSVFIAIGSLWIIFKQLGQALLARGNAREILVAAQPQTSQ